ncbi:uncharacterized protein LOC133795541 [Humulus lupulus]|uniref:uncharacterized protein LOC133795541 n=1 Tax=Humulus lupulus TaxID=3486 RepID=UPI002B40623C|nr:uncharacterized protein LOC133795541 [Humulus lupulus]
MKPDDQEKTTFIMERGTFCYKVMLFGLKNAGATYQRLVNRMFTDMLGKSMEVYIDDMFIKSLTAADHLDNLKQSFQVLQKYNMKLNPAKCSFGVSSGKFLGYLATKRGVEASPNQIRSIQKIQSPKSVKDVQHLTGKIAALNRFVSKSYERCHLFFSTLRKTKDFEWTEECEDALRQLKEYLASPPLLAKPKDGESLYMYLAISGTSISAVLIREEEGRQQPVYYVSKTLLDVETRYIQIEKLALALPELSRRLTKWAVELSEYDITFQLRIAIKSQVLADFIADFSSDMQVQAEKELLCLKEQSDSKWKQSVDGSSNSRGCGLGVVLTSPQGDVIQQAIKCDFKATNNETEYEALIVGLDLAKEMNIKILEITSDSQLIVNQFNGTYQDKNSKMVVYLQAVKERLSSFTEISINPVPRIENSHADALANLESTIQTKNGVTIPVIYIQWPVVWKPQEEVKDVSENISWMTPIIQYLTDGTLPQDRSESRKIRAKAARFTLYDGKLYKRSFFGPLLRCLTLAETHYVLTELHEDDFSRFTWLYPLKHKSDALSAFLQFKSFVKNQFETRIKALRADWGGEFQAFNKALQESGILFQHSCPHTLVQNGRVKQKHRHIVEMGLTLLAQASMPYRYWVDAFQTSVYLINRVPTPILKDKSPFETL